MEPSTIIFKLYEFSVKFRFIVMNLDDSVDSLTMDACLSFLSIHNGLIAINTSAGVKEGPVGEKPINF